MAGNPPNVPTENIDEVILRLLALEPNEVDELDYETYRQYLKELLIEITSGKRKIDSGEAEQIKNEFVRVKGKKGRFKISSKKTKVTANGLGLGGIRKQMKGAQQRIMLMPVGGIPKDKKEVKEKVETVSKKKKTESDPLIRISKTLDSILKTLISIDKENKKKSDTDRRESERKRRGSREKELESKPLEGIKKAISNILKPFQSIWDTILNFIGNIILGRILIKLIDWFADPNNQGKIQSIIRFFSDHWPTLLALYLRFGTGIGRFIGKLTKILVKGTVKLVGLAAKLAAKAGLKGFGKVASFIGGPRGRLLATGIGIAADVAVTAGTAAGIGGLASGDIKIPGFSGGGWNKGFGNLFSGTKNFFGNMFSGLVKGPKGKDKVPAMLTDGEFVVSAGAVKKYGVDTFESMNAAGGGTNVPQIASGMTFAEGGGYIGGIGELRRKYDAKHGEGAYDKESARRRAVANATPERYNLPPLKTGNQEYLKQLKERAKKPAPKAPIAPQTPKTPQINIKAPTFTPIVDPKREAEKEARKKARAEYTKIITNMDHPDYDKAWNDPKFMDNLREKYRAQASAPTPSATKPGTGYTPYVSRFAGARDAAHERASRIQGSRPYVNPFSPGGMFGGPRMQARTDYAKSKGKYYSSSDQKTYGNYNDAMAAKKSRMTSLASQQRLNKLSSQGAGPKTGRGIRYTTESVAQAREDAKRGGFMGQLGRGFTRMFSDPNSKLGKERLAKLDAADKASTARVKQAGAASIGRYYSSSDGKYYKDYNAAVLARKQRLKSGVKPLPKPKPKPQVAGGGMGGKRGSGSSPSNSQKPKSQNPTHSAKSTRTARSTLGVNKK